MCLLKGGYWRGRFILSTAVDSGVGLLERGDNWEEG